MKPHEQRQLVESWIRDLSIALGVELSLDKEGVCTFQVGDDTLIGIELSTEFPIVSLYSPLLTLPQEKESATALIIKALELNAFQALTRGGAIAIAPGGGPLFFCYTIAIEGIDSEKFSKILGGFFETLPQIKSLLSTAPDQPSSVSSMQEKMMRKV